MRPTPCPAHAQAPSAHTRRQRPDVPRVRPRSVERYPHIGRFHYSVCRAMERRGEDV